MKVGEFLRDKEGNEFFIELCDGKVALLDSNSEIIVIFENETQINEVRNLIVELLDKIKE